MKTEMVTCTRVLEFDYGHRVLGHQGKCASLHGHRGKAEITCQANKLNALGMVIDFGKVKELVGKWIDDNWDHTTILSMDDPALRLFEGRLDLSRDLFGPRAPYVLLNTNPTAEVLAGVLFRVAGALLEPEGIEVVRVRFHETPNCWADWTAVSRGC